MSYVDHLSISDKGNFLVDNKAICNVTHPNMQNDSGLSRGRAIHLTVDGKKSICNMLVDHLYQQQNFTSKKQCKICFKEFI